MVMLRGLPQRFCQQCGTFHPISEFDADKRCAVSTSRVIQSQAPSRTCRNRRFVSQHASQAGVDVVHASLPCTVLKQTPTLYSRLMQPGQLLQSRQQTLLCADQPVGHTRR